MPEILTAIPTFNAARFLPETLECIASQTRKPDRVIVIDAGKVAADGPKSILQRHQPGRAA